jgi:nucleotide-binding universal stress UspA family protein
MWKSERQNIMSSIVCATRGGEGSRAAQLAAINRAKETGKPLLFLYIVDPTSLDDQFDDSLKDAIVAELNWMGKTLLHIAQKRAETADLGSEINIRQGQVQHEIARFVKDVEADLLVLGAPRATTTNIFGDDAIERLAEGIQQEAAVSVEIIRPDYVNEK